MLSFSTSRYGEPTTFGEFIRRARLEKRLRQKDVAEAIGVDEMTVVNWEKADRMPRRHTKVQRLCILLGFNFENLAKALPR